MKLTRYTYSDYPDDPCVTQHDAGEYVLYTEAAQQIEALRTAMEGLITCWDSDSDRDLLAQMAAQIERARKTVKSAKEGQA